MQNVKETAEFLLIGHYANVGYSYDYSNISCSWRKCRSGLFQGAGREGWLLRISLPCANKPSLISKMGLKTKGPGSCVCSSCLTLLFWSVAAVSQGILPSFQPPQRLGSGTPLCRLTPHAWPVTGSVAKWEMQR